MTTINRKTTEETATKRELFDKPVQRQTNVTKKSVISDPEVSINDRLELLAELTALIKDTKNKIESVKDTFKDDLISFLDNADDDRPMITHNTDKNKKVYLQIRKTYQYEEKLALKAEKIRNLQQDLKAEQEKAVRYGKAELVKQDFSVVFKG
tara:strand:+ start:118 stop:576 length:459 start_codon:yes stop_codon:yes gene_type:complete